MENWYKTSQFDKSTERYAGWILSDGTVKSVPSYSHLSYVLDNYALFGLSKEDLIVKKGENEESKIYGLAFIKGAIRFSCKNGGDMSVNGLKSAIYKNSDKLHSIAKTQNATIIYLSLYKKSGDYEYEIFNSIAELYSFSSCINFF